MRNLREMGLSKYFPHHIHPDIGGWVGTLISEKIIEKQTEIRDRQKERWVHCIDKCFTIDLITSEVKGILTTGGD